MYLEIYDVGSLMYVNTADFQFAVAVLCMKVLYISCPVHESLSIVAVMK